MSAPSPSAYDWRQFLRSMRVRILAAVVVLLAGSSAVSIALLRSVLLDHLDEEIAVALQREIEEFELLADGLNPRTGVPFGDDFGALFDVYFAREVPDEGEALLAFQGSTLVTVEEAPDAPSLEEFEDAIEYWLSLDEFETGSRETAAGEARYAALPLTG